MKITGEIKKFDDNRRLVFGWASVSVDADGKPVIDSDGDFISIDELERSAYEFVLWNRDGSEMHSGDVIASLVESMVFTSDKIAMLGIEGNVPLGWWVGFKVFDGEAWAKIKDGTYSMFSIGGSAKREVINNERTEGNPA